MDWNSGNFRKPYPPTCKPKKGRKKSSIHLICLLAGTSSSIQKSDYHYSTSPPLCYILFSYFLCNFFTSFGNSGPNLNSPFNNYFLRFKVECYSSFFKFDSFKLNSNHILDYVSALVTLAEWVYSDPNLNSPFNNQIWLHVIFHTKQLYAQIHHVSELFVLMEPFHEFSNTGKNEYIVCFLQWPRSKHSF